MQEIQEILWEVCRAPGSPGQEGAARDAVRAVWERACPHAKLAVDPMGSLAAFLGDPSAPVQLLFDAHLDQIGMVVTGISKEGFLHIAPCGGVDRRVLPGSPVDVYGRETRMGIVCCQPPHLADGKPDRIEPVDEMYVDLGLKEDEAKQAVSPGDMVLLHTEPRELLGSRVTAAGLDNRAGVSVLLRCAQLLSGTALSCGITFLFSTREELGCEGARTAAYSAKPTHAVVVDVSFAGQPGVPDSKSGKMGGGIMIGCAPSLDKAVTGQLTALAKQNQWPYQQEVMGGRTGTNADVISTSRAGIPTGLVSIPLRYMHTTAEIIDLQDAEHAALLLAAYAKQQGGAVCG